MACLMSVQDGANRAPFGRCCGRTPVGDPSVVEGVAERHSRVATRHDIEPFSGLLPVLLSGYQVVVRYGKVQSADCCFEIRLVYKLACPPIKTI